MILRHDSVPRSYGITINKPTRLGKSPRSPPQTSRGLSAGERYFPRPDRNRLRSKRVNPRDGDCCNPTDRRRRKRCGKTHDVRLIVCRFRTRVSRPFARRRVARHCLDRVRDVRDSGDPTCRSRTGISGTPMYRCSQRNYKPYVMIT